MQQDLEKEIDFKWKKLKSQALTELGFKRKQGRPSLGNSPRVTTSITIDSKLKSFAKERGVNLSDLLNNELKKVYQESNNK